MSTNKEHYTTPMIVDNNPTTFTTVRTYILIGVVGIAALAFISYIIYYLVTTYVLK
jgi:hypothetical protein